MGQRQSSATPEEEDRKEDALQTTWREKETRSFVTQWLDLIVTKRVEAYNACRDAQFFNPPLDLDDRSQRVERTGTSNEGTPTACACHVSDSEEGAGVWPELVRPQRGAKNARRTLLEDLYARRTSEQHTSTSAHSCRLSSSDLPASKPLPSKSSRPSQAMQEDCRPSAFAFPELFRATKAPDGDGRAALSRQTILASAHLLFKIMLASTPIFAVAVLVVLCEGYVWAPITMGGNRLTGDPLELAAAHTTLQLEESSGRLHVPRIADAPAVWHRVPHFVTKTTNDARLATWTITFFFLLFGTFWGATTLRRWDVSGPLVLAWILYIVRGAVLGYVYKDESLDTHSAGFSAETLSGIAILFVFFGLVVLAMSGVARCHNIPSSTFRRVRLRAGVAYFVSIIVIVSVAFGATLTSKPLHVRLMFIFSIPLMNEVTKRAWMRFISAPMLLEMRADPFGGG